MAGSRLVSTPADELDRLAARTLLGSFTGPGEGSTPKAPAWVHRWLEAGLGGVCLYGENCPDLATIKGLTADLHATAPAAVTTLDEEGGDVTRLHYRTGSPHAGHAVLGAVDDLALTRAVAAQVGVELRAHGVDLDLGPVADVNSNPLNPVIGVRSFGAEPSLVAEHVAAWVEGLQAIGVGACLKHFPGHGDTVADSHLSLPAVEVPLALLEARELVPFRAGVQAGALAVMTSHVVVRALDPSQPATFSAAATDLLRRTSEGGVGFDGLLVSDALDMKGASGTIGIPAAAVRALTAGVDLLCVGATFTEESLAAVHTSIVAAVRSGELSEERLTEAAGRVEVAAARMAALREAAVAGFAPDGDPSETAAREAISVSGRLPDLHRAQVVTIRAEANQAVGVAPWGLPVDGALLAGLPGIDVGEGDSLAQLDASRPVVVVVRDAHRRPWMTAAVQSVVQARPDAVVVELGWPGPDALPGATVVHTRGASAVSTRALDALLSGS